MLGSDRPEDRLDLGGLETAWTLSSVRSYPFSISPSEGARLRVAWLHEAPALGSDLSLDKLTADARLYQRVFGERDVLALRAGGGTTYGERAVRAVVRGRRLSRREPLRHRPHQQRRPARLPRQRLHRPALRGVQRRVPLPALLPAAGVALVPALPPPLPRLGLLRRRPRLDGGVPGRGREDRGRARRSASTARSASPCPSRPRSAWPAASTTRATRRCTSASGWRSERRWTPRPEGGIIRPPMSGALTAHDDIASPTRAPEARRPLPAGGTSRGDVPAVGDSLSSWCLHPRGASRHGVFAGFRLPSHRLEFCFVNDSTTTPVSLTGMCDQNPGLGRRSRTVAGLGWDSSREGAGRRRRRRDADLARLRAASEVFGSRPRPSRPRLSVRLLGRS